MEPIAKAIRRIHGRFHRQLTIVTLAREEGRGMDTLLNPRPHPHEHSIRTRNFSRTDRPDPRPPLPESRNSIETAAATERPRSSSSALVID